MSKTSPKATKVAKDRAVKSTLDRRAVVFDGDRDQRKELEESRSLARLWQEAAQTPDGNFHLNFLKYHVQLGPRVAPHLFACVERCKKALGVEAPIEVFCVQKGEANAYLSTSDAGRIVIGISNHALRILGDDELCWVLGHQLGHAIFDHLGPQSLFKVLDSDQIVPLDRLRFFAWMRYAELTADRVGLLCAGELEPSISAMFKMASGLNDPKILGNLPEVSAQYASLQVEGTQENSEDWFSLSPFGPLRVKALELFYRSRTGKKLTGKGPGDLTEAALEREVASIVGVMNPSFLDERSTCRREIREFLVYGGMRVAAADNKVARREVEAIRKLVGEGGILEKLDEAEEMSSDQLDAKLGELSAPLCRSLPAVRRQKLLEDLCLVAAADKKLAPKEQGVLSMLGAMLALDPLQVGMALDRLQGSLD